MTLSERSTPSRSIVPILSEACAPPSIDAMGVLLKRANRTTSIATPTCMSYYKHSNGWSGVLRHATVHVLERPGFAPSLPAVAFVSSSCACLAMMGLFRQGSGQSSAGQGAPVRYGAVRCQCMPGATAYCMPGASAPAPGASAPPPGVLYRRARPPLHFRCEMGVANLPWLFMDATEIAPGHTRHQPMEQTRSARPC